MKVLGIETSCDETAAAIIEDGTKLLSNVIASSVDLHASFGGVVPEIAARSHIESIIPVIKQALGDAKTDWRDLNAIGVTYGPGLSGSLVIGLMTARTLSITKQLPLYAVNHVEAHSYAAFITSTTLPGYSLAAHQPKFPALALIISGGHTQLVLFKNHFDYRILGQTADDAIGEAFDKVAKIIGLPYPGGPSISQAALDGDPNSIDLPRARMPSEYDFSFSGLKTAVLRASQKIAGKDYTLPSTELPGLLNSSQKADIAASFQDTALRTVVEALKKAETRYAPASVIVAGGVAANSTLRKLLEQNIKTPLHIPDIKLCTDNAAMIAVNAYYQASLGRQPANSYRLEVSPNLSM